MQELQYILQDLGFDDKQAAIYLAALELGSGSVQDLAKKSGVTRTNIYNYIDDMKVAGLLSEIRDGKRVLYIAEDPHTLIQKAEKNLKRVEEALPQFMGIFNTPSNKPRVRFFDGIDGVKRAYKYYLEATGPIYAVTDVESMMKVMPNDYMWEVAQLRAERNITFKMIAKDDEQGRLALDRDDGQLRETRLVKKVTLGTEINIFDNKVIMISFRRPVFAVVIEGNAIADTMRMMWKGWWGSLEI